MDKKAIADPKIGESAKKHVEEFLAGNAQAFELFQHMEKDDEVQGLLEQVNTVAIGRLGYNDHGLTHSRITTLHALKILEILHRRGVEPNLIAENSGTYEDAQLIVMAGTYLHDLGNAIHRDNHFIFSTVLTNDFLTRKLSRFYKARQAARVKAAIMECLYAHDESVPSISIESGCVKVADGTDMAKGRARIPFSKGKMDIHAVSALAIDKVSICEGEKKPVQIVVEMSCSAGLFQIQEVLGLKINTSSIRQHVEVIGTLTGQPQELLTKVVF